jgi:hypothetical protein
MNVSASSSEHATELVLNKVRAILKVPTSACLVAGSVACANSRNPQQWTVYLHTVLEEQAETLVKTLHGMSTDKSILIAQGNGILAWCSKCRIHGHSPNHCESHCLMVHKRDGVWSWSAVQGLVIATAGSAGQFGFGGNDPNRAVLLSYASERAMTSAAEQILEAMETPEHDFAPGSLTLFTGRRPNGCNKCGKPHDASDQHGARDCQRGAFSRPSWPHIMRVDAQGLSSAVSGTLEHPSAHIVKPDDLASSPKTLNPRVVHHKSAPVAPIVREFEPVKPRKARRPTNGAPSHATSTDRPPMQHRKSRFGALETLSETSDENGEDEMVTDACSERTALGPAGFAANLSAGMPKPSTRQMQLRSLLPASIPQLAGTAERNGKVSRSVQEGQDSSSDSEKPAPRARRLRPVLKDGKPVLIPPLQHEAQQEKIPDQKLPAASQTASPNASVQVINSDDNESGAPPQVPALLSAQLMSASPGMMTVTIHNEDSDSDEDDQTPPILSKLSPVIAYCYRKCSGRNRCLEIARDRQSSHGPQLGVCVDKCFLRRRSRRDRGHLCPRIEALCASPLPPRSLLVVGGTGKRQTGLH